MKVYVGTWIWTLWSLKFVSFKILFLTFLCKWSEVYSLGNKVLATNSKTKNTLIRKYIQKIQCHERKNGKILFWRPIFMGTEGDRMELLVEITMSFVLLQNKNINKAISAYIFSLTGNGIYFKKRGAFNIRNSSCELRQKLNYWRRLLRQLIWGLIEKYDKITIKKDKLY